LIICVIKSIVEIKEKMTGIIIFLGLLVLFMARAIFTPIAQAMFAMLVETTWL